MEDAARLATERDAPAGERDEELALAARSDPAGKWTVTVKELIRMSGDERLDGPWVLKFSAP